MLEIFCCELRAVDADLLARYRDLLNGEERERLAGFRRKTAAQTYLISRALARTVLAEKLNCDTQSLQFARDANDKPQLIGYPLHFNVSHSEDWIALAIGDTAVGIDVETSDRRNNILGIAKRYFPRAEFDLLSALPEIERAQKFCELWTLKEACVKWSGLGIGLAIAGVGVTIDDDRIALDLRADVAAFGAARALLFALTPHIRLAAVSTDIDACALQKRVPLGATELLSNAPLASS